MGNRAITVNYVPDGDDWQITVTEGDHTRRGTAAGLIAARDTADQLVAKIDPDEDGHVVHLLDGDAFAFTSAYLHARHGLPPAETTPSATGNPDADTADQATDAQLPAVTGQNGTTKSTTNGTQPHETGAETTTAATETAPAISAVTTVPGGKMITVPTGSVRLAAPIPAPTPEPDKEQHPV